MANLNNERLFYRLERQASRCKEVAETVCRDGYDSSEWLALAELLTEAANVIASHERIPVYAETKP